MRPGGRSGRQVHASTSAFDVEQVHLTDSILVVVSHNHQAPRGRDCGLRRICGVATPEGHYSANVISADRPTTPSCPSESKQIRHQGTELGIVSHNPTGQ